MVRQTVQPEMVDYPVHSKTKKSVVIEDPKDDCDDIISSGFACGSPNVMKLVSNVQSDFAYLTKSGNDDDSPVEDDYSPPQKEKVISSILKKPKDRGIHRTPSLIDQYEGEQNDVRDGVMQFVDNVQSDINHLMSTDSSDVPQEEIIIMETKEASKPKTAEAPKTRTAPAVVTGAAPMPVIVKPVAKRPVYRKPAVVTANRVAKELCKLVDDHYTRQDAMFALQQLFTWAQTECPYFMTYFDRYAGIANVVDLLKEILGDLTCTGPIRIECIQKVAMVIKAVVYSGAGGLNKEIADRIAISFVECDGIDILKQASDEYKGEKDPTKLGAVRSVWGVFRNVTCKPVVMKTIITQDQAIDLLNGGINVIGELKYVEGNEALSVLEDAFITMSNVVSNDFVEKKHLYNKHIIRKCLSAFKKQNGEEWMWRSEVVTNKAINFFIWCHNKNLLEDASESVDDHLLSFFAMGLKLFPTNERIQTNSLNFLEYACSVIQDKSRIEKVGAMESLSNMLISPQISANKKKKVRRVIMKIAE